MLSQSVYLTTIFLGRLSPLRGSEDSDQNVLTSRQIQDFARHAQLLVKEYAQVLVNHLEDYGKCPKILNTKVSDKMLYANSADPDQTALEGAVWPGTKLFAIQRSILRNNCNKKQNLCEYSMA